MIDGLVVEAEDDLCVEGIGVETKLRQDGKKEEGMSHWSTQPDLDLSSHPQKSGGNCNKPAGSRDFSLTPTSSRLFESSQSKFTLYVFDFFIRNSISSCVHPNGIR